jgi:NAD(P)H-flavin reductase
MSCASDKAFMEVRILTSSALGPDVSAIECAWAGPPPLPGQFFLMRAMRSSVLLGRAISVFGWRPYRDGGGQSGGVLRFLVARRGRGSAELVDLPPGDTAELTGPLGTGWPAPADGRTALVAGGVGIAPLAFLASSLPAGSYDLYAGFRSGGYGLDSFKPRSTIVATEDGSAGRHGRIPEFFDPGAYATVYACGPEPMLGAVARACASTGAKCYVSMERRMACGVGACLGCTVLTVSGNRRCCVDGPVFDAREVILDN